MLLLPIGVPPTPAPKRSTQILSQDGGVWRVLKCNTGPGGSKCEGSVSDTPFFAQGLRPPGGRCVGGWSHKLLMVTHWLASGHIVPTRVQGCRQVQHAQARCQFFRGCSARAVRQFAPARPCSEAQVVMCCQRLLYPASGVEPKKFPATSVCSARALRCAPARYVLSGGGGGGLPGGRWAWMHLEYYQIITQTYPKHSWRSA